MPLIASGAISSPVSYVDIDLPTGYELFALELAGFVQDGNDNFVCRFSADSGASFPGTYDWMFQVDPRTAITFFGGRSSSDGQLRLGPGMNNMAVGKVLIFPGSDTLPATVRAEASAFQEFVAATFEEDFYTVRSAGRMTTAGRQNLIRIAPYFDDGFHFTAGTWFLRGELTPGLALQKGHPRHGR